MSRLEVPLLYRTLYASGDLLLRAELNLLVRDQGGIWHPETFRVDSGTEMSTMPASLARTLGLPMPQNAVTGAVHTQTGLEFRSGLIRVQVIGMDATEYVFSCFFLGDPNLSAGTSPGPTGARNLLGLSGVINQLRLLFDGEPAPGAPHGQLIVEKKGP
jgi:hypothetical protein